MLSEYRTFGYLWNNGYIPAYRINSVDARTGKPNGYMGVPASYKPAFQPLLPYPADYLSRSAATDPMYQFYGTNTLWIPLNDLLSRALPGAIRASANGGWTPRQ